MSSRTVHMVMAKDFLINMVRQYGAKDVLPNFDGTNEQAIKAIQEDPREVFASCKCEQDERGYCTGRNPQAGSGGPDA